MTKVAEVVIPCPPKSKERPRFSRHAYMSKGYKEWKRKVRHFLAEWWTHPRITGPAHVIFHFYGAMRGDLDNLEGAVLDAMQPDPNDSNWPGIIENDSVKHVIRLGSEFHHDPKNPRIYMCITWEEES